jgi:AsmA family protein
MHQDYRRRTVVRQSDGMRAGLAKYRPKMRRHVLPALLLGLAAAGVAEFMGWPFLERPLERALSAALQRSVTFTGDAQQPALRVHLFGGVSLRAGVMDVAAPSWSDAAHTARVQGLALDLRYGDLWRAAWGGGLNVRRLSADRLDATLERLPDGRATWQMAAGDDAAGPPVMTFELLEVRAGHVRYDDALQRLDLDASFALRDASAPDGGTARAAGLHVEAKGRFRGQPTNVDVRTGSVLPLLQTDRAAPPVTVVLKAAAGASTLDFSGTVVDALRLAGLRGGYRVTGPSLGTAGDALGLVLPATGAFDVRGRLARQDAVWATVVDSASVGESRLRGAFRYDASSAVPRLEGRLQGELLKLADLAPAIGAPAASAAPASADGRVLPDRAFDLPQMRAMDANVSVDIDRLDPGSLFAEALTPLRAGLQLSGGVLTLDKLYARTASGTLAGRMRLDGRETRAKWDADLRWSGIRLEQWVKQTRAGGDPPCVSGRLSGQARVSGSGRSTASILASLQGNARLQLTDAAISHLALEAGGLDVAQGLGVLVSGDDALPVRCAAADLDVARGVVTPRVLVIDTDDSTVWVDGSVSLASERLDLRAVVTPRDFSPLALRTPVHVTGPLSAPQVTLEKAPLLQRLLPAALLALVTPVAGLLPLLDIGDDARAGQNGAGCRALAQRARAAHGKRQPAGQPGAASSRSSSMASP